ncbi:PhnD/SsuA/transferrin family substrate-binding protein [Sutterella sp.]|uniref:sensor histidine kinase n=1 Tax=Sutterella sp. TaxID=1981025 RepID=UPI0026E0D8FF|nr:PhnD/SsuA/transferrin family substrate-binding protein [Sutterella sp.]MDO5532442.1 PhnD/SsuA/transferrin family substrate-binding protein [Sutterella sp.]
MPSRSPRRTGTALAAALVSLALLTFTGPVSPREAVLDGISGATEKVYQSKPLRVGIISLWETPETTKALHRTLEVIRQAFAPYPVEIYPRIAWKELQRQIEEGEIDVFIASSGFSMRMQKHGVVQLATLITKLQPNPNTGVATAFLVRSDDDRFHTIAELKGTRLSASYVTAFMSYRTGLGEIAVRGFDPEHFFGSIHYTGDSENESIAALLDRKEADVAMVRACWLEGQPPEVRARYRVIEPREDPTLHCEHTSRTYPNIMVSVLEGSAPGAAHIIAKTLLSMPEIAPGHKWGVATDLRPVNRLYRELKIENYAYLREPTIKQWMKDNPEICVLSALLLLGLVFHSWRVGYLVRKRTAELRASIAEERAAQVRINELRGRMERMQKATIVGQLSNLIAHELAQPLAAVQYYAEGMKDILSTDHPDLKLLEMSRAGIVKGLARTRSIVERVRGYSKNQTKRDDTVMLVDTIERVFSSISTDVTDGVDFSIAGLVDVQAKGDALELELLFSNLLKNAFDAASTHAKESPEKPAVRITASPAPDTLANIVISVANTGRVLSDKEFSELTTPLITSKSAGQGLGIPIATAIAEASGGHLTFEQRPKGGVIARVTLPLA